MHCTFSKWSSFCIIFKKAKVYTGTLYVYAQIGSYCTMYTVHCTHLHCTLYTVHCTLCTVHCTLYTVYALKGCCSCKTGFFVRIDQINAAITSLSLHFTSSSIHLCCSLSIYTWDTLKTYRNDPRLKKLGTLCNVYGPCTDTGLRCTQKVPFLNPLPHPSGINVNAVEMILAQVNLFYTVTPV